MNKEKHYGYSIIRQKGNQIEYEIIAYNEDGSFDDYEDLVVLNKNDDIKQYIREHYGQCN